MFRLSALMSVFLLSISVVGVSHAHEHDSHDMSHDVDTYHGTITMEEQHKAVALIWKQWTEARTNLSNGDRKMLGKTVDDMLKASAVFPQFMPHKNSDRMDEFKGEYRIFKERLERVKRFVDTSNTEGVNMAMDSVEQSCDSCHARFKK